MTNKSFIVKNVFVDVDICEKIDKRVIDKNLSIDLDKHESFDDIAFETIFAQNICFFDVVKNVANKINSIKIDKINTIKIFDEIKSKVNDEIKDFCENVTNNASSLSINKTSF